MSELITAANIDLVIEKNNEIRNEVLEQTMKLQVNHSSRLIQRMLKNLVLRMGKWFRFLLAAEQFRRKQMYQIRRIRVNAGCRSIILRAVQTG